MLYIIVLHTYIITVKDGSIGKVKKVKIIE